MKILRRKRWTFSSQPTLQQTSESSSAPWLCDPLDHRVLGESIFGGHLGNEKRVTLVKVVCWVFFGDEILASYGYFMNHEIRIPSLNNQDSMESRRFFFVAQVAAFCFSTGQSFCLRRNQLKRAEINKTSAQFFPTHQYLLNPKHGVFFYLKNALKKKWHEIPKLWTHQDLVGSRSMENVRSWLSVNGSHVQSSVSRRHTDVSMEDAMQDGTFSEGKFAAAEKSYGSAMFLVEPFIIKVMEVLNASYFLSFEVGFYTLVNYDSWKMDPEWVDVFPMVTWWIFDCYVSLPEVFTRRFCTCQDPESAIFDITASRDAARPPHSPIEWWSLGGGGASFMIHICTWYPKQPSF